jgi:hypothetical protein
LPGPGEAFDQQQEEREHAETFAHAEVREGRGEGEEEDDFDVEDEKDDGVKVIAGVELYPCIAFSFKAAFVDGVLGLTGFGRRKLSGPEPCQRKRGDSETESPKEQNEDRQIRIVRHVFENTVADLGDSRTTVFAVPLPTRLLWIDLPLI